MEFKKNAKNAERNEVKKKNKKKNQEKDVCPAVILDRLIAALC